MKKIGMFLALVCVIAGVMAIKAIAAEKQEKAAGGDRLRVGLFDSRALAIAFARSEEWNRQLRDIKSEYEKAKAAGNEKRVKEIDTQMSNHQKLAHKQAFGTWPVDDILDVVKAKLPGVAKDANVDVIVSKWHVVYQAPSAELVDVTETLANLFNPSEQTLKMIRSLKDITPASLEEIEAAEAKGGI